MQPHSAASADGNSASMPADGNSSGNASLTRGAGDCSTSGLECPAMTTSGLSLMQIQNQLTFSLGAHPVSRSQSLDEDAERTMTATSGRQCFALSNTSGRLGVALRTLLESTAWFSKECRLTWKAKVTKSGNRLSFQLAPSTRTIGGTGSGLLPTLLADDHKGTRAGTGRSKRLQDVLDALLPTLTVHGNYNRKGASKNSGDGLATAIQKLMPTLAARDYRAPNKRRNEPRKMGAGMKWDGQLPNFLGLKLSARFCERFMGFPQNWTELQESKPSETPSSRKSPTSSAKLSTRRNSND